MTVRDADFGSSSDERRRGSGRRLRFEALVAVGDADGGAAFEAESIDVSPDGMRLRTAYLPEIGERLLCRFEGVGTEVVAEAEVIWREEQDRGGEFGLRFMRLDAAAQDRLRVMCAPEESENAAENGPIPMGARVRLHIEGLASPMKARVRETATGELRVGSNLEFLRVGQRLDLEDVDQRGKRGVVIEHVAVEVDPETNVPQLVVSLRYPEARPVLMPSRASAQPTLISPRPEAVAKAAASSVDEGAHGEPRGEGDDEISVAVEDEERAAVAKMHSGLRGVGQRAAEVGRNVGGKVAPALATFAARSKEKLGSAFALLARKREERLAGKKSTGPRRTTAPPPKGALTAEGRRLVRDDEPESSSGEPAPRKKLGRSAVVGGLLGVLAVMGVLAATRLFGSAAPATTAEAPTAEAPALAAAASVAPGAPGAVGAPATDGAVTTNIPLFGATPLSTTEPVPTAPPDAPPLGAGLDPAADPLLAAAGAAADGASDEPGAAEGDGDSDDGEGVTEWGAGNVKNPVVLKLKMDGVVERIDGAKGAMGFTISVPGRRALSSGADLARKDKRIAAVDVVNSAHGAEITLRFKDGVPAYLAKANGARLEIAIGDASKKAGVAKKADAKKADKKVASKAKADAKKAKTKGTKKAAKASN